MWPRRRTSSDESDDDNNNNPNGKPLQPRCSPGIPHVAASVYYRCIFVVFLINLFIMQMIRLFLSSAATPMCNYKGPFFQAGGDMFPFVNHIVYTNIGELHPTYLATLDSYLRHGKNETYKIWIAVPEGCSEFDLSLRFDRILKQIQFFIDRGLNGQVVFVDNITRLIQGTPFEGMPFRQRHIGGLCYDKPAWDSFAHASDLIRAAILFKEGGFYRDSNYANLRPLRPIFDRYGKRIIVANLQVLLLLVGKSVPFDDSTTNSLIVSEPRDLFITTSCEIIREEIEKHGIDHVFRWNKDISPAPWTAIGPATISRVMSHLISIGYIASRVPDFDHDLEGVLKMENEGPMMFRRHNTEAVMNPVVLPLPHNHTQDSLLPSNSNPSCLNKGLLSISTNPRDYDFYKPAYRYYYIVVFGPDRLGPLSWASSASPMLADLSLPEPKRVGDPEGQKDGDPGGGAGGGLLSRVRAAWWSSELDKRMAKLKRSYLHQFFNDDKQNWLEIVRRNEEFPLAKYILENSCLHLCDRAAYQELISV